MVSPEGWDGEGGGRGVQDGEHMYTHGKLMFLYIKMLKKKKRKENRMRYLNTWLPEASFFFF